MQAISLFVINIHNYLLKYKRRNKFKLWIISINLLFLYLYKIQDNTVKTLANLTYYMYLFHCSA